MMNFPSSTYLISMLISDNKNWFRFLLVTFNSAFFEQKILFIIVPFVNLLKSQICFKCYLVHGLVAPEPVPFLVPLLKFIYLLLIFPVLWDHLAS